MFDSDAYQEQDDDFGFRDDDGEELIDGVSLGIDDDESEDIDQADISGDDEESGCADFDLDAERVLSDDPVRMYLTQMGKFLLSRQRRWRSPNRSSICAEVPHQVV